MNTNNWEAITLDIQSFSPTFQMAVRKEQERREGQERQVRQDDKNEREEREKEIRRSKNLEVVMESSNRQILINYFLIYELIMKGVRLELEKGNYTGARRVRSIEVDTENTAIQGYVQLIRTEKKERRTRDIRRYIIFMNNCMWEILNCLGVDMRRKFHRGTDLFSKRIIKQYVDRSTDEVYGERMIEEIGKKMKERMQNRVVTYGELINVCEEVREEMELVQQDLIFVEIGNRKPEERVKKEYEMSEESEETEIEEF